MNRNWFSEQVRSAGKRVVVETQGRRVPRDRWLFSKLLGAALLKDLLNYHVPSQALVTGNDFRLAFFSWLPLFGTNDGSQRLVSVVYALDLLAVLCLMASYRIRWAAGFLLATYGYTFLSDQLAYTNNVFLAICMLAALVFEPTTLSSKEARYPSFAIKVLITIVYLTSFAAKLTPTWLSGHILDRALHTYHYVYARNFHWYDPTMIRLGAWGTPFAELLFGIGLWIPRWRRWIVVMGVVFHATIELTMPVRTFSYLMCASYVLFASEKTLRNVENKLINWTAYARTRGLPHPEQLVLIALVVCVNLFFIHILDCYRQPNSSLMMLAMMWLISVVVCKQWPEGTPRGRSRPRVQLAKQVLVYSLLLAQMMAVCKPLAGYSNQFAWRMFSETLQMNVHIDAKDHGKWRSSTTPVATQRWAPGSWKIHWDSWSEEKMYLEHYAAWVFATCATCSHVRLVVRVQQNKKEIKNHVLTWERPVNK
jgi:hypothetical protein